MGELLPVIDRLRDPESVADADVDGVDDCDVVDDDDGDPLLVNVELTVDDALGDPDWLLEAVGLGVKVADGL